MKLAELTLAAALAAGLGCGGAGSPPAADPSLPPATETSTDPGGSPPAQSAPSRELLAGIKAFDAGRFAEARGSFEGAVKKNPKDYEALYNLGMTLERLQDAGGAESAYKSALAVQPGLEMATAELSALWIDEGRTEDAIALARAGLTKHPASGPLHENLAVALAVRGSQDESMKEFAEALQTTPGEPMVELTFAHWLNVWHRPGAASHLDAARDLAKDNYALIASVGHEYRMAGEFESCAKTFDREIGVKDGGEVRTERALCRLGLKDDKGALDDLKAAIAAEPSYAPGHYYLAGRLAQARHFKEAAAEYARVLSLEPNGSLAKPASERLKAAQQAGANNRADSPKRP
ncbi:MAG: tetratricopeptide repeat protein [Polyangiaceae bacterium]